MADILKYKNSEHGMFGDMFISVNTIGKFIRIGLCDSGYETFTLEEFSKFKTSILRAIINLRKKDIKMDNLNIRFKDLFIRYDTKLELLYIGMYNGNYEVFDIELLIELLSFINKSIIKLKFSQCAFLIQK